MNNQTKSKNQEGLDAAAAKAAAEAEAAADGRKVTMGKGLLTVTGPETGRRRAGHVFGKEPVNIDASTLTQEQVDSLNADPLLSVKQGK